MLCELTAAELAEHMAFETADAEIEKTARQRIEEERMALEAASGMRRSKRRR